MHGDRRHLSERIALDGDAREMDETIEGAIAREKLVKKWRREWKFALIEADNPEWDDLWEQWFASVTDQK